MILSKKIQEKLRSNYGSWAVVTGATSGLGLAITTELAKASFNIVLNARNTNALYVLKEQLINEYAVEVIVVPADLSVVENCSTITNVTKHLDVGLVVLAAGFGTSGAFYKSNLTVELNMLQTNCASVVALTHYYSNLFVLKQRGGIILFSSLVGFQGTHYAANYAATKAFIQSFAEAIAAELQPFKIDVLAVAPGPVATNFGERANMKMNMAENPNLLAIPILKALGKQTNIVPGKLSKLLTYSLRLLPRWGKIQVMNTIMKGMTKHQLISI